MKEIQTVFNSRLPHIAPIGASFFVTFRLADSLPGILMKKLQEEFEGSIRHFKNSKGEINWDVVRKLKSKYFKNIDIELDASKYGSCILRKNDVAQIVKNKLHQYANQYYDLVAYCIMPNHVHILIDTSIQMQGENGEYESELMDDYVQLHKIMNLIKGGASFEINRFLKRKGVLWQKDSYDTYIRNDAHFYLAIQYILQNPVKAGLVKTWELYPHTYLNETLAKRYGFEF